ncbi:MAG: hypothetical protein ABUS79_13485 [Pseudomonadota bacterium]
MQGSGGSVQSHGAQLVPAAQAGQVHTAVGGALDGGDVAVEPAPAVALPLALPVPVLPLATVMVVVEAAPQLQLHGAHAAPGGQVGQAQVQVPPPLVFPVPVVAPQPPPVLPPVPPPPLLPPVPVPQSHLQGGQAAPGAQAGQAQVQVPPPPLDPPPS